MPNAFWCIVEDDRNGSPKKVMAEVIGEASRLAPGKSEAGWLTRKGRGGRRQQTRRRGPPGEGRPAGCVLLSRAALAPPRGGVGAAPAAELAGKEAPKAIFAPVTSR